MKIRRNVFVAKAVMSCGMIIAFATISLCMPALSFSASATANTVERIVSLSCKVSEDWLQALIDRSTLESPPTREMLIEHLESGGLYSIEASFDPSKESDGFGMGVGSFMGHSMPYWITPEIVVFMTADDSGGLNSILDRYTGTLSVNIEPTLPITYQCVRRERQY